MFWVLLLGLYLNTKSLVFWVFLLGFSLNSKEGKIIPDPPSFLAFSDFLVFSVAILGVFLSEKGKSQRQKARKSKKARRGGSGPCFFQWVSLFSITNLKLVTRIAATSK